MHYHLPLQRGYKNCTIVHLEMVNILLALHLFASRWTQRRIRVTHDNQAVVHVLRLGRTKDLFLAACAFNIWFCPAKFDVDIRYDQIQGVENKVVVLLSRRSGSRHDWGILRSHIPEPLWLQVTEDILTFDPQL